MASSFLVKKVNEHLELNTQRPPSTRRGSASPAHGIYQCTGRRRAFAVF